MATRFHSEGDRFVITQSSRGFRVGFTLFVLLGAAGVVLGIVVARTPVETSFSCDAGKQTCTLTQLGRSTEIAVASVKTVRFDKEPSGRSYIELRRKEQPSYFEMCGSKGDAAAAKEAQIHVGAILRFLGGMPNAAAPSFKCSSLQSGFGSNPALLVVAFLGGVLVLLALFRRSAVDVRARFDRAAGTMTVRRGGWLPGSTVEKPLADVAAIEVLTASGSRGARYYLLVARLRDGAAVVVWAPAAASPQELESRKQELERFLAGAAS